MSEIVNKVANSGLVTLDFEEVLNVNHDIVVFDIKDYLFKGLLLKEKDFRASLKETDWSKYQNKVVAIQNSNDAIVPKWAYMLLATYLVNNCLYFSIGNKKEVENSYFAKQIGTFPFHDYQDKRVILKGCGDKDVPANVYMSFTEKLIKYAKTIMYGEPCSTVPVFKKISR